MVIRYGRGGGRGVLWPNLSPMRNESRHLVRLSLNLPLLVLIKELDGNMICQLLSLVFAREGIIFPTVY